MPSVRPHECSGTLHQRLRADREQTMSISLTGSVSILARAGRDLDLYGLPQVWTPPVPDDDEGESECRTFNGIHSLSTRIGPARGGSRGCGRRELRVWAEDRPTLTFWPPINMGLFHEKAVFDNRRIDRRCLNLRLLGYLDLLRHGQSIGCERSTGGPRTGINCASKWRRRAD